MNYPYAFSGNLMQDSQALFGILTKELKFTNLNTLEKAYKLSCDYQGLLEETEHRTPGSSFNPKPARIAQILIEYLDVKDELAISLALLVNAKNPDIQNPTLKESFSKVKDFHQYNLNLTEEAVLLAEALDRLRHLHLSKNQEYTKTSIEHCKQILTDKIINFSGKRIQAMLELAFSRAQNSIITRNLTA